MCILLISDGEYLIYSHFKMFLYFLYFSFSLNIREVKKHVYGELY